MWMHLHHNKENDLTLMFKLKLSCKIKSYFMEKKIFSTLIIFYLKYYVFKENWIFHSRLISSFFSILSCFCPVKSHKWWGSYFLVFRLFINVGKYAEKTLQYSPFKMFSPIEYGFYLLFFDSQIMTRAQFFIV